MIKPMISDADKRHFQAYGYLVVERLVPEPVCAAARAAIAEYLGLRADDPETWYRHTVRGHGIIPLHHAQAFWDLRQHPAVHAAFAALYGSEKLWVSIDRASFKPPSRERPHAYRAQPFHWDGDPRRRGLSIQGLVYLSDTSPEQGGFCCVPEFYRQLDTWLEHHTGDTAPQNPDVRGYPIVRVGAPAGSLVVWNRRMPHTSAENVGDRPRWVQYVTMDPEGDEAARAVQAAMYREKRPPAWALRQQIPEQQIPEPGEPARLTELGRKLAGVTPW
jgi:ectoine hydroxylase-related dioxygenase (phytanoyl-CoA dioxygenase family)